MATSFAAFPTSSQPMFLSFSTDDGSRVGHGHETDLDDLDDPHLSIRLHDNAYILQTSSQRRCQRQGINDGHKR
ncbi:uncharacterized protein LACBIDRAFT_318136 [Laccaria bicolor S238N-H82]|uniref:Predicted protein n=1 Tax=Laccaria bicolor (strain S238N-H82 / ATCC MYA-4686) TaxID=486041 RepID=B0D629_LACBS|nr:uncharacterized protein LACBIDRAFT_318136 [Laccaria bicolor S238N-H82]EDR09869.1 predicted protein [Laccaria bicolor S238N-H82]|eukprot:XP_001879254.1 predicted protein [Laccaria bicolor S238N-H82]